MGQDRILKKIDVVKIAEYQLPGIGRLARWQIVGRKKKKKKKIAKEKRHNG